MSAALDEALTAAAKRLRATPHIDEQARTTLHAVIVTAYDHRPAAMRDLSRAEYRAQLGDSALVEMYTHCVFTLGGQYERASAHLLHTLHRLMPSPAH
ncbi:hypothetical protein ACFV4P_03130 [Kitasatospora sp. NPDC059795]|uniref:hypothetical protein n=1 Tax=Kitasatospora sp. NPDC059795 TaxID=3346949 RepID=UPI00365F88F6